MVVFVFTISNNVFSVEVKKKVIVEVCGELLGVTSTQNGNGVIYTINCDPLKNDVCYSYEKTIIVNEYTIPPQPNPFTPIEPGATIDLYQNGSWLNSGIVNYHLINVFYPYPGIVTHEISLTP